MAVNNRTATTTQIRNFYSDMSYMNTSFYNNALSLRFCPFMNKDQNGRNNYDMNNAQVTTISYELVYALYSACKDVIEKNPNSLLLNIPCNGANLVFDHKSSPNSCDTVLSINKNNTTIPFKFGIISENITVDGQSQTKIIPAELGSFMLLLEGFLTGINSERHLNKLTDDYIKSQQGGNQNNNQNNGYKNNYKGGYKKNNYKPYNNNNNQAPVQQQNMSTYNIPYN